MPFEKGNKLGFGKPGVCGRKPRAEEWGVEIALRRYWKAADRKEVIVKLVELAKGGEIDAMRLLFAYAWGRPRQQVELSGGLDMPQTIELRWPDVRDICQQQGLDPEIVKFEAERLLAEASAEEDYQQ